jgi:hypothetical protein
MMGDRYDRMKCMQLRQPVYEYQTGVFACTTYPMRVCSLRVYSVYSNNYYTYQAIIMQRMEYYTYTTITEIIHHMHGSSSI